MQYNALALERCWNAVGERLRVRARIYLCGRTCVEGPAAFVDDTAFPARQGRLAWTYLVLERHRMITRDNLIEAVWGEDPPDGSDRALSAILSKLRALLARAGIFEASIHAMGPGIRLVFPPDIWIDWETAYADIERAARHCRENNMSEAYGWALATYMIAREDLVPGEETPWLVRRRGELGALLMRAIDLLISIYRATANDDLAIQFAEDATLRDPLREQPYRELFELYAGAGNRSGAMQAYAPCCDALAAASAQPSAVTEAAYRKALALMSERS